MRVHAGVQAVFFAVVCAFMLGRRLCKSSVRIRKRIHMNTHILVRPETESHLLQLFASCTKTDVALRNLVLRARTYISLCSYACVAWVVFTPEANIQHDRPRNFFDTPLLARTMKGSKPSGSGNPTRTPKTKADATSKSKAKAKAKASASK